MSRQHFLTLHKDRPDEWDRFCIHSPVHEVVEALTILFGHADAHKDTLANAWVPILCRPTLDTDIGALIDAFGVTRCQRRGWRLPPFWCIPIRKYPVARSECVRGAVMFMQKCVYDRPCCEGTMGALLLCTSVYIRDPEALSAVASVFATCSLPEMFSDADDNHFLTVIGALAPMGVADTPEDDTPTRDAAFRVFWTAITHYDHPAVVMAMLQNEVVKASLQNYLATHPDTCEWFKVMTTQLMELVKAHMETLASESE